MACSVAHIVRSVSLEMNTLWRTLSPEEFLRRDDGTLWYAVGNSAVVFKAKIAGRWCSLKCYTSSSDYRGDIYGTRFLCDELYVFSSDGSGQWRDVVVDQWVEGISLGNYIERCVEQGACDKLQSLSRKFDKMALDMLRADWAHGDIACDNIIVNASEELILIDFDASFIPSFDGRNSVEVGTAAYQHPSRSIYDFNRDVDDFSLAVISVCVAALSFDVSLYERYRLSEGLMLRPAEVVRDKSAALQEMMELFARQGEAVKYRISHLLKGVIPTIPELKALLEWQVEGAKGREALTPFVRNCAWGYLDEAECEMIPPMFNSCNDFRGGFAAVQVGTYWHYIHSDGTMALNCSACDRIASVSGGLGRICVNCEWCRVMLPQK